MLFQQPCGREQLYNQLKELIALIIVAHYRSGSVPTYKLAVVS